MDVAVTARRRKPPADVDSAIDSAVVADAAPLAPGGVRLPKITQWLDLPGEYDGLKFLAWINCPNRMLREFQSGDDERIRAVLTKIILSHNGWADDEGEPFPSPTTAAFWQDIPTELAALTIRVFTEAVNARPQSLLAKPDR